MKFETLSQKQINSFAHSNARINILEGSVRSGKSLIALMRFIEELRSGPNGQYVICGRSEITIIRNVISLLNEYLGNSVVYNKGQSSFNLFGKRVFCVGANDERAELKIRGATFAGALVDEITAIPESFFKMLLSRLSIEGAKLIGTTNPDNPFHWLKKEFIDREKELDLKVFRFNLDDNPSLSEKYKNDLKKEYSGVWYQRFILGEWCLAEGLIYSMFDRSRHLFDKPHTFAEYYIAGVDVGSFNPSACVLVGYNSKIRPNIWIEREYFFDSQSKGYQKTDGEIVQDLVQAFEGYPIKMFYGDPAASSFEVEMKRRRLPVCHADNDVIPGIRFVSSLFAQGDLAVCKPCAKTVEELFSYSWDPRGALDGKERPLKKNDHLMDAMRYALYTQWGKKQKLVEKTQSERFLEREQRKFNQNPMQYPGLSPGSWGWTNVPGSF